MFVVGIDWWPSSVLELNWWQSHCLNICRSCKFLAGGGKQVRTQCRPVFSPPDDAPINPHRAVDPSVILTLDEFETQKTILVFAESDRGIMGNHKLWQDSLLLSMGSGHDFKVKSQELCWKQQGQISADGRIGAVAAERIRPASGTGSMRKFRLQCWSIHWKESRQLKSKTLNCSSIRSWFCLGLKHFLLLLITGRHSENLEGEDPCFHVAARHRHDCVSLWSD